jgi:hypothetical protein
MTEIFEPVDILQVYEVDDLVFERHIPMEKWFDTFRVPTYPVYPSDMKCGIKCIRDKAPCVFKDTKSCRVYKKLILKFKSRSRWSYQRYRRANGGKYDPEPFIDIYGAFGESLRNGFICPYCGAPMKIYVPNINRYNRYGLWSLEHIWPISQGGGNGRDNIAICCLHCNMVKGGGTGINDYPLNRRTYHIKQICAALDKMNGDGEKLINSNVKHLIASNSETSEANGSLGFISRKERFRVIPPVVPDDHREGMTGIIFIRT